MCYLVSRRVCPCRRGNHTWQATELWIPAFFSPRGPDGGLRPARGWYLPERNPVEWGRYNLGKRFVDPDILPTLDRFASDE